MTGTMLGESMRRRRGARRSSGSQPPARSGGGSGWIWWLLAFVLLAPAGFGTGYLVAARVLFPAPTFGGEGVVVPPLAGMTPEVAERELAALGLELSEIMELPHPDRAPGTIIAQTPLPGQRIANGGPVEVAVSAGPPRAAVPDVSGMPADGAAELLGALGFQVARRDEPAPEQAGRVVRTDPRPGTELLLPADVAIIVSAGMPVMEDTLLLDFDVDPGRTVNRDPQDQP